MKSSRRSINFHKMNLRNLLQAIISVAEAVGNLVLSIIDSINFLFSRVFLKHFLMSLYSYFSPSYDTDEIDFFDEDYSDNFFGEHRGGNKFIGKYSVKDAEAILRMSPVIDRLNYEIPDWYIEFDLSDCFSHYGYIRSRSIPEKEKYYAFIIVQVGRFEHKKQSVEGCGDDIINRHIPRNLDLLNIRWFSLQNPRESFTKERPRLPGQNYPGTGMGKHALQLVTKLAMKSGRDGIVNNPEHFHNAYMYIGFKFLNPTQQGLFQRMVNDLMSYINEYGLAFVSWSIYLGYARENGKKIKWDLREQVLPLSIRASKYFYNRGYRKEVDRAMHSSGPFTIDLEAARTSTLSKIITI
jgi:hypothetical protein